MFTIFGKGKVGNGLKQFLEYTQEDFVMMDDSDYNEDLLEKSEKIILSPGIPPKHKLYQNFGEKIYSELSFLGEFLAQKNIRNKFLIIGISGTNGKSTTTHIAYNLLKKLSDQVHLSGNFGTPFSQTLTEILKENKGNISKKQTIVMEVSSFMLYQIRNFNFDYSILTNVEKDHLDRHHNFEDYRNAKTNLIKYTEKQAFTTPKVFEKLSPELKNKTEVYDHEYDLTNTNFVGFHNQANLQAVYLLSQKINQELGINITKEEIQKLISEIQPLAHRLQLVKEINGIKIYDDAICTSAHAQENALKSFSDKVVLICGGYDKGDSFDHLADLYKEKVAYGVFIGQTAPQFEKIFSSQNIPFITETTLHSAITNAYQKAVNSQTKNTSNSILFSPGCASFGMFKNVYDRIEKFTTEIENL